MSGPVTTYNKGKPFAWSYSKIKNYRVCPKKYYHVDVAKDFKEDESEILTWGNLVHKAFAERLSKKKPLPIGMEEYEPMLAGVEHSVGKLYVEQKYGLKQDLTGTGFFGADVWYRGIADVVKIHDDRAVAIDWKLGKVIEDSMQLALVAACVFGHFPSVRKVESIYVWLKFDADTKQTFTREDMPNVWSAVLPDVSILKKAHEDMLFEPKPGGLCEKWCPVKSCPHWGLEDGYG